MLHTGTTLFDPHHVLHASGIRAGDTVVDLLCGHQGHSVFPAAERVGPTGVVYAVDIRRPALESVMGRLTLRPEFNHVVPVRGNHQQPGGVPLPDGVADVVLMVNTLSLTDDKLAAVREAVRLLRSGGRLAVVDWRTYGDGRIGPEVHRRVSEQEARSTCLVSGLDHQGSFPLGQRHYGFVCKKS